MFSFNMFHEIPRSFGVEYTCYSVSMLPGNEREDVEKGGKIIMPPSALDTLTRLNINYPMLFKLTNRRMNRITHSGVLEFVADETKVYLPYWMMRNLLLEEGQTIFVESVALPVATFSRFQPQSEDFLDITNPKAVLENCLRSFACLTTGDIIGINYNSRLYELCVLETKPGNAVTIIECDMNVDFAPPVGYKEPQKEVKASDDMPVDTEDYSNDAAGFVPFGGEGNRLDGKKRKSSSSEQKPTRSTPHQRGIPDYNYQVGYLKFFRNSRPSNQKENDEPEDSFTPFAGAGFSLRANAKKK